MNAGTNHPSATALAHQLLEAGLSRPAINLGHDTVAVAWALKELCYGAWSSEPQRATKAAEALRALCEREHALPAESALEIAALADWTAGIAHITQGQMAEATHCFDLAAATFQSLSQSDHATQTQVPKIMALSMLGQFDEAIACAERAQKSFVALGDARGAGKVSLNLGALHVQRGAYVEAARFSREASVLFARVGDHEHSVMADLNMADALTSMGDFDEALRIYARAQMRAQVHAFPVLEANVENAVALLHLAQGRFRDALVGLEGSRKRYEQLDMPQHLAVAEANLADAYLELRLLPEALTVFDQAVARFGALHMPAEEARTLAQRGRTQALLGQRLAAAESFRRASTLFAAQGSRVGRAAVALARAELALASGDADVAKTLAEEAAEGFDETSLAESHARSNVVRAYALLQLGHIGCANTVFEATLVQAHEMRLVSVAVRCHTGKGLAARARGESAVAKAAFNDAIALFEDQRRALPGDELRSAFLTDHLRPYHELLRTALTTHRETPTRTNAIAVVEQLDCLRARSLGKRLADGAGIEDGNRADDNPATRRLRERLNWLYRQVQRLEDEGESAGHLIDEVRHTESALLEDARRARFAASAQVGAAHTARHFSFIALQDALGESGALIAYGVLDDELFAYLVTRTAVTVHRQIASWSEVQNALRAARFQLETLRHGVGPVQHHLVSLTHRAKMHMARLHGLVFAPLASALAGCRGVLVVPHAELGLLPFAALHDGVEFLAQRHEFAMVPSARLALRGLLRQPGRPRQVLALGESTRLPHAAAEAHLVASLFPASRVLVALEATTTALLAHAHMADVIHLACHAVFRSDNPRFSALHLSDGPFTVELAESMKLKPCVVVLSACETGLAELSGGDEMVGLVRAFIVAGAARVVASLWPVDDTVAALFMGHFYAALGQGERPAVALRLAQCEVMRSHPHPFYWAAFTLYGAW